MINITDEHNCCGCSACVQACTKQCISFEEDEKGFRYPLVNKDLCIDCGLCEKVCPCLNQNEPRKPLNVYAAINLKEETRMKSSSGGIFTMLAEEIIDEGGVVFGARFDENWEVKHDYTENKERLEAFRGSKYVQSCIGETYKQAKYFLKQGRKVLYSGTSCQIAGLKHFLRNEYDNLLTVEVICHGVPSPKIWREYLQNLAKPSDIKNISMKDKSNSWRSYHIKISDNILDEESSRNKFLYAFSHNLILRPCCFNCPAKAGKCYSDTSLADYWGIEHIMPEMDDDKGTSFVCANTIRGQKYLNKLSARLMISDYDASTPYNPALIRCTKSPSNYDDFWENYRKDGIKTLFNLKSDSASIIHRILNRSLRYINKIL